MGPPGRLRNGRGDRKLGRLAARTRLRRGHSPPSASAANLRFLSFVAASSFRNLKFKSRTRFIELLVVLRFRSSYRNMPRALTNFGIGPLAGLKAMPCSNPEIRPLRDGNHIGIAGLRLGW